MDGSSSTSLRFEGLSALPKILDGEPAPKRFFEKMLTLVEAGEFSYTELDGSAPADATYDPYKNETVVFLRAPFKVAQSFAKLPDPDWLKAFITLFIEGANTVVYNGIYETDFGQRRYYAIALE